MGEEKVPIMTLKWEKAEKFPIYYVEKDEICLVRIEWDVMVHKDWIVDLFGKTRMRFSADIDEVEKAKEFAQEKLEECIEGILETTITEHKKCIDEKFVREFAKIHEQDGFAGHMFFRFCGEKREELFEIATIEGGGAALVMKGTAPILERRRQFLDIYEGLQRLANYIEYETGYKAEAIATKKENCEHNFQPRFEGDAATMKCVRCGDPKPE